MPETVYIALGTNLGSRENNLSLAIMLLEETAGIHVVKTATVIETEPIGPSGQGKYYNTVCEIECSLEAHELLRECQRIENDLGRIRLEHWGPRVIDLDIILFGSQVIDTADLVVPHPEMHKRDFVLKPLCEIAPDIVHPVSGSKVEELLACLETDN